MFHTGMSGTRIVPLHGTLQGMTGYKRDGQSDTRDTSGKNKKKKEQKKLKKISYGVPLDIQRLLGAETVSNVQDVKEGLKNKKLAITNSDMTDLDKQISLEKIQNIEERCNRKVDQLRFELLLKKEIAQAKQDGDTKKVEELEQKYNREKTLRKTEEYTELQHELQKENYTETQRGYIVYNANQAGSNLLHEINGLGNYVDLTSVE